jgi:hypothetical protein
MQFSRYDAPPRARPVAGLELRHPRGVAGGGGIPEGAAAGARAPGAGSLKAEQRRVPARDPRDTNPTSGSGVGFPRGRTGARQVVDLVLSRALPLRTPRAGTGPGDGASEEVPERETAGRSRRSLERR